MQYEFLDAQIVYLFDIYQYLQKNDLYVLFPKNIWQAFNIKIDYIIIKIFANSTQGNCKYCFLENPKWVGLFTIEVIGLKPGVVCT